MLGSGGGATCDLLGCFSDGLGIRPHLDAGFLRRPFVTLMVTSPTSHSMWCRLRPEGLVKRVC